MAILYKQIKFKFFELIPLFLLFWWISVSQTNSGYTTNTTFLSPNSAWINIGNTTFPNNSGVLVVLPKLIQAEFRLRKVVLVVLPELIWLPEIHQKSEKVVLPKLI